ncbi:hypothetical protein RYH80_18255 [Halobaculum sp. MBLA0147]|uniref:hypothetical protein n=1 Tax=Halobaculum sp. MBLA0147 TaxID=3079934 RepID=UPI003524474E
MTSNSFAQTETATGFPEPAHSQTSALHDHSVEDHPPAIEPVEHTLKAYIGRFGTPRASTGVPEDTHPALDSLLSFFAARDAFAFAFPTTRPTEIPTSQFLEREVYRLMPDDPLEEFPGARRAKDTGERRDIITRRLEWYGQQLAGTLSVEFAEDKIYPLQDGEISTATITTASSSVTGVCIDTPGRYDHAEWQDPREYGYELPLDVATFSYTSDGTKTHYPLIPVSGGLTCGCPRKAQSPASVICKHEVVAALKAGENGILPNPGGLHPRKLRLIDPTYLNLNLTPWEDASTRALHDEWYDQDAAPATVVTQATGLNRLFSDPAPIPTDI